MARTFVKSTGRPRRRFDPMMDWIRQQQQLGLEQVEERRQWRLLRRRHSFAVRLAKRHEAEYPAGPTVYGDDEGFYPWLERRDARLEFDPHWTFTVSSSFDDSPLPVRSAEPCQRCRANPRVLREPYDSCTLCTSRDMCYVQFRNGKVIIAPNPENRWSF